MPGSVVVNFDVSGALGDSGNVELSGKGVVLASEVDGGELKGAAAVELVLVEESSVGEARVELDDVSGALWSFCSDDELTVTTVIVVLKDDCGVAALVMVRVCRPAALSVLVFPDFPMFMPPSELVLPDFASCDGACDGGDLDADLLSGLAVSGLARLSGPWGTTAS